MSLSVEGFSSALSATGLVRRNSYDFDFVEILGRFINNKTFAEGFQDYMTGRGTAGRDVWATLSAIGQDVGDELYRRVVHYIDDVSNSDTCRLQALKSMLKELGFEYTVFDSYKFMPAELQNAVDLMSISPCQLLRNGFMRDDFAAALCAEGVVDPYDTISALVSADAYACSDYFDMPGQASSDGLLCCFMLSSDGWISSDLSAATGLSTFTYDETAFSRYVENIYRSIIGGFLTMTYNNKAATPVYMSINKEDRYYNEDTFVKSRDIEDEPEDYGREDYYEFKAQNGIEPSFDPIKITDAIDAGTDRLENYSGARLALLQAERRYRDSNLFDFLGATGREMLSADMQRIDQDDAFLTRGSFYRKRKMLEYARFVDMKWYVSKWYLSGAVEYRYDKNYYEIPMFQKDIRHVVRVDRTGSSGNDIDWGMVDYIAKSLTRMTLFIQRLRELIRLQTRKNYMRGTANLVKFVVNELLIEYARYNEHFTDDSGCGDPALSAIYKCLSAHPLGNVEIEEYWDKTEYFNIETDTSERSPNGKYVNPRYFENLDKNSGKHLAPADIDNFYLDGLGARYDLVPSGETTSSDLHKFLEAVYDAGADNTFVDWKGRLNTSLPDGAATFEYKEDFETISGVYEYLISSQRMYGYQFDASASIGDQIDDYLKNVKTQISSMYYLNVYSLQRQLEPAVQKLEREIDALSAGVGNYIGSTYSQYFEKSEDSRCYDDETGDYLYDWFVGNETYKYDRLYDCIKRLNSYVRQAGRSEGAAMLGLDGTIHNWVILNHLKNVVDSYDDDKTQLDDLISEIESYHAVGDENLEVELETLASYLQKTYDNRMQSLQQMLEEFKKQLDKCDSKYEDLVSRKDDYLLRMPPQSTEYCFIVEKGKYGISDEDSSRAKYPDGAFSGKTFRKYGDDKMPYSKKNWKWHNISLNKSTLIDTLQEMLSCTKWIETEGIYLGSNPRGIPTSASIQTLIDRYNDLVGEIKALAGAIVEAFNLVDPNTQQPIDGFKDSIIIPIAWGTSQKELSKQIQEFILALQLEITNDVLEKDPTLMACASQISRCAGIAGRYEAHKREYDEFQTNSDFYRYLDGFTPGSEMVPSNFQQLSARIEKIDKAAQAQIISDIQDFFDKYDSVMSWAIDQFDQARMYLGDGVYRMYRDIKSGDQDLEDILTDLRECISTDVYYREADAIAGIQREIDSLDAGITRAYDIIARHALGKFDAMDDDYRAVKALSGGTYDALLLGMYGKLDYMNKPEFRMKSEMWPSYIGTSAAYDPYYNLKNQTHPSYQTHQFPWRFIKYASHMQGSLEKLFIGAYLQDLTPENIASRIDGYIGGFGQVIDKWKNSANCDFTGYTTRYESDPNFPDSYGRGVPHECVAYDGCFYPPALADFLADPEARIREVEAGAGGFYERFYSHLGLSERARAYEASMLRTHLEAIKDVAADHLPKDVYDVYKYAIDAFGNSYILYKRYKDADAGIWEKRDTGGVMWMREKNHPIGFPVFSSDGFNSMLPSPLGLKDCGILSAQASYYASRNGGNADFIYEFEMNDMQDAVLLAVKNLYDPDLAVDDPDYKGSYEDPRCRTCNQCVVMPLMLSQKKDDDGTMRTQASMLDLDVLAMNEHYIRHSDGEAGTHYTYAGMYTSNDAAHGTFTKIVFIERTDGVVQNGTVSGVRIPDDPRVKVMTFYNGSWITAKTRLTGLSGIQLDQAVFAFYNDDTYGTRLDMAFVKEGLRAPAVADYNGLSVDVFGDSSGLAMGDPSGSEYNAYDTFNQNVVVASMNASKAGSISMLSIFDGNTNADMSYTPHYPSYDKELGLGRDVKRGMQAVEALGRSVDSRRIRAAIDAVNPSPDPYIDMVDLASAGCYGRVYEDWDESCDKTIHQYECGAISQNTPAYKKYQSRFEWVVNMDFGEDGIPVETFYRMKFMMFNMNSYGQNPYLVCDFKDIVDGTAVVEYDTLPRDRVSYKLSSAQSPGGWMQVVGTQLSGYEIRRTASNNIFNVSGITVEASPDEKDGKIASCSVVVKFHLIDENQPSYIEKGEVKIAVLNLYDLTKFKFYHYLDNYGVVSSDEGGAYAIDLSGNRKYLKDVDFQDYGSLSDIFMLTGNLNLSFKYSEEDLFAAGGPLYYTPGLNCKYPLTRSQYYMQAHAYGEQAGSTSLLCGLFNAGNLFILDPDVDGRLSGLGKIDVQTAAGELEVCRVYEDYLSDDADHNDTPLWKEYDPGNAEFCKYIHFLGESGQNETIDVPDEEFVKYKTGDDFSLDMIKIYGLSAANGEGETGSYQMFDGKDTVELGPSEVSAIEDLSKIYAFYDYTDDDGITLYFNYTNYLHSPYLKIVDGRTYIDTIDGTYLRLKPGEDGTLDVVVQFQRYYANTLVGVRNVCVASYRIYNVSDDKPKFLIMKTYECEQAAEQEEKPLYDLVITPEKKTVEVEVEAGVVSTTGEDSYTLKNENQKFMYRVNFAYSGAYCEYADVVMTMLANEAAEFGDFENIDFRGAEVQKIPPYQCRIRVRKNCRLDLPMTVKDNVVNEFGRRLPVYIDVESSGVLKSQIKTNIGYLEFNPKVVD